MELLFIFVVFDQHLPPTLPNYRKNSVGSKFCESTFPLLGNDLAACGITFADTLGTHFFLSFFFFMSEKRLFPLKSQMVRGGGGFSVTLGESFQHRQLQFPLLQLFQLQCSEILWLCGHPILSCLIQKICLYDKEKASLSSLFFFCSGSHDEGRTC